ncbi:MAG: hypothetical protein K5669_09030 [Lachnospiraceae bacterium]|nr:hypothetical protein [Lachnospiraceae bacterium]
MAGEQFHKLREEYKYFRFKSYEKSIEEGYLCVKYHFEIDGLESFVSKWKFPLKADFANSAATDTKSDALDTLDAAMDAESILTDPIMDRMLFSLGMVETISYYKITCPKTVSIECGNLSKWQTKWWQKLYRNGLGEFLYLNGISYIEPEELVNFEFPKKKESSSPALDEKGSDSKTDASYEKGSDSKTDTSYVNAPLKDSRKYEGALVPIGGGKDSCVSLEVLKGEPIITYTVNGNETTRNVIDCCDYKAGDYVAKRILDKKILEMNEKGFMNGHIPFSAVVAFSAVISAYITGRKNITLSNENSANESTVKDSFVNHQYSKSYEFEKDFEKYFKTITDSDIHYFSLLRPLTELQIAHRFSKATKYHKVFRSCNRGSKQGIWCCNCPKCLFVYIILTPFINEDELVKIFGEKLLDKESLDLDFRELCGIEENKPFECVGTRREVLACLKNYIDKGGKSLLTDRYFSELSQVNVHVNDMLTEWNDETSVPENYLTKIREV